MFSETQLTPKQIWYLANKAKSSADGKAYYAVNREKVLARQRANYAKNKARKLRYCKQRYDSKRDSILALARQVWKDRKSVIVNAKKKERRATDPNYRARSRNQLRKNRITRLSYERRYAANNPGHIAAKHSRRRARKFAARTDGTAEPFIRKVRATTSLPCNYCGKIIAGRTAHIDHMIPLAKGGSHTADNLCAACSCCNCSKSDKTLAEWIPPIKQPVIGVI